MSSPFTEFLDRYKDDWVSLVHEVLDFEPDADQQAILRVVGRVTTLPT